MHACISPESRVAGEMEKRLGGAGLPWRLTQCGLRTGQTLLAFSFCL